jgi:hypothetical protein
VLCLDHWIGTVSIIMYKVKKVDSGHGWWWMHETSSQALVDASQAHRLPITYRNSFWVLNGPARSEVLF